MSRAYLSIISRNKQKRNTGSGGQAGFTIVELLIVVVVIAVLAAIAIVSYNGITNQAKSAAQASELSQWKRKAEVYKVQNGIVCPANFSFVYGNSVLGTSDFCVMKYEAKILGNDVGTTAYNASFTPESRATGTPWVSINQTQAATEATEVCSGCQLITDAQWMTIAADVMSVKYNWSEGEIGAGRMHQGHVNSNPASGLAASADDTAGTHGITGGFGTASGTNSTRVLYLKSGDAIWDFTGNVNEWTSATIAGNQQPGLAADGGYTYKQWNHGSLVWGALPVSSRPVTLATIPGLASINSWNYTKGIGQLYSNANSADSTRVFLRGGSFGGGAGAGVLMLDLPHGTTTSGSQIGFRATR